MKISQAINWNFPSKAPATLKLYFLSLLFHHFWNLTIYVYFNSQYFKYIRWRRVCLRFHLPHSTCKSLYPLSEKAMAPHSSTLAWKIPWAEEPGALQSMGSLRVQHNWVTPLSLSCIGEGNGNPLQCSCLENPRDGEAWWAAIYGVTESRTRLMCLSSSSSSILYLIRYTDPNADPVL